MREPAIPDRKRRRGARRYLGPLWGLDWAAIALLPATAVEFGGELGSNQVVAAHLFADYSGPYLALLATFFGLAPGLLVRHLEPTRPELLTASTLRVVVMVVIAVASMRLLVQPEFADPLGPTWRLFLWLGGLALPLWANMLFLRLRGVLSLTALAATVGVGAVFAGAALAMGVALVLPPAGMVVPVALGGSVYVLGIAVACWTDVTGPYLRVVMATSALSALLSFGVAMRIADPPLDTLRVTWFEAWDPIGQRVTVQIERPASQLNGFVEFDLRERSWEVLGRRVERVTYSGGRRVVAQRPGIAYSLDTQAHTRLCVEDGDGERCGPSLRSGRGLLLLGHDRAPLVVANRRKGLVVWNVQDDAEWSVRRDGARIRWPCFVDGPGLYWRVDRGEPPFDQELLMLRGSDAEVQSLTLSESRDCANRGRVDPVGRFVRGRGSTGRASLLFGPGLPEAGVVFDGLVVWNQWSDDGSTLGLLFDPPAVAYWSPEFGLTEPQPRRQLGRLEMSPDGKYAVHLTAAVEGNGRWAVHRVPGDELIADGHFDAGTLRWDDEGGLITLREGRLVRIDPFTATTEVLFPPSR